jgi:hypothetical protein
MFNLFQKKWPDGERFNQLLLAAVVSSHSCAKLAESRYKHKDFKRQPTEEAIYPELFRENLAFYSVVLWYFGSEYFGGSSWEDLDAYIERVFNGYIYFFQQRENDLMTVTTMNRAWMALLVDHLHGRATPSIHEYIFIDDFKILRKEMTEFHGADALKASNTGDPRMDGLRMRQQIYEFRLKKILEQCELTRNRGLTASEVTPFMSVCILANNHLLSTAIDMTRKRKGFVSVPGTLLHQKDWFPRYWYGYGVIVEAALEKNKGYLEKFINDEFPQFLQRP